MAQPTPQLHHLLLAISNHHYRCPVRHDGTCTICAIWDDACRMAER